MTHTNHSNEYLTFFIDNEEYAVNIFSVKEITTWEHVKPLLDTPPDIMGVMNLRGDIVPIIDLRQRLKKSITKPHKQTVIIILHKQQHTKNIRIGITVDHVSEVRHFSHENIRQTPVLTNENNVKEEQRVIINNEDIITLIDPKSFICPEITFSTSHENENISP